MTRRPNVLSVAIPMAMFIAALLAVQLAHNSVKPQSPMTATQHEQPRVILAPERAGATHTNTTNTEQDGELQNVPHAGSVSVDPYAGNPSSSALADQVPAGFPGGSSPKREPVTANTKGQPSADEASRALRTKTGPIVPPEYNATMFPKGTEENAWQEKAKIQSSHDVPALSPAAPVPRALISKAMPARIAGSSIATSPLTVASSPVAVDPCLTTAPAYQPQCVTASAWRTDIAKKYGATMGRRYAWLGAQFVADWLKNGCAPSPCTFDKGGGAIGRLQPADYAGLLGYDSPLGTCHDSTQFSRRVTEIAFDSESPPQWPLTNNHATRHADGSVTGWAIYNGRAYLATLVDPACTARCVAKFDRPCELPIADEDTYWTWYVDPEGRNQVTRWRGGDTSRPDPMFGRGAQ
jgi:hypothetical protein